MKPETPELVMQDASTSLYEIYGAAKLGLDFRTETELSERYSSLLSRVLVQCPNCLFVSDDWVHEVGKYQCMNCGSDSVQRMWPESYAAIDLLRSTIHFYKSSYAFLRKNRTELLKSVEDITGVRTDYETLFKLAKKIDNDYSLFGGTESNFGVSMKLIQDELGFEKEELAEKVFLEIFNHLSEPHENKAVLVMCCSLIEVLSYDLIRSLYKKNNVPQKLVDNFVSQLRTLEAVEHSFRVLTDIKLSKAIPLIGYEDYYTQWKEIVDIRNKLIHSGQISDSDSIASTAFDLALKSFDVFGKLHNRYVVSALMS